MPDVDIIQRNGKDGKVMMDVKLCLEETGKRIMERRKKMGLTQEQLAEKVGVRRETIMRLEKAQYNPSLKLAIDISRAVEAPIEEIFIFD